MEKLHAGPEQSLQFFSSGSSTTAVWWPAVGGSQMLLTLKKPLYRMGGRIFPPKFASHVRRVRRLRIGYEGFGSPSGPRKPTRTIFPDSKTTEKPEEPDFEDPGSLHGHHSAGFDSGIPRWDGGAHRLTAIPAKIMPAGFNRRTATKVRDGRVRRKNRHRPTGHRGYVLDREPAGHGFRHVVSKRDVQAFIEIIPDWDRYSERLRRIVLEGHSEELDGAYEFFHREETGIIFLCAWPADLWISLTFSYFDYHAPLLEELGVSGERRRDGVLCRFTEAQARAFTLLHVLMHELGHHWDRLHQKHADSSKGEEYAERFANSRFWQLFPAYQRVFGHPRRA